MPRVARKVLVSQHGIGLGYLDRMCLDVVRTGLTFPAGTTPLSEANAIRLAIGIAARVIETGELDRFRTIMDCALADYPG